MSALTEAKRNVQFFQQNTGSEQSSNSDFNIQQATDKGTLLMKRVPVFRSGTFRDSWGDQMTFEAIHIHQMVLNFNSLKTSGVFPDVPVRAGHPGFLSGNPLMEMIGYVNSLEAVDAISPVDGNSYTYLLAEYEILKPEAIEAVETGLWRSISAEIGEYVTNNEVLYWPTLAGFAYVDIPAVEGLKFSKGAGSKFSILFENESLKEKVMAEVKNPDEGAADGVTNPAVVNKEELQETDGVVTPEAPEGAPAEDSEEVPVGGVPVTSEHDGPGNGEVTPEGGSQTYAKMSTGAKLIVNGKEFSINSENISEFQAYIDELEGFQRETKQASITLYADDLVRDNKIFSALKDDVVTLLGSLNYEQSEQFRSLFERMPQISTLANHAGAADDFNRKGEAAAHEEDSDMKQDLAVYNRMKLAGISGKQIEATSVYQRLKEANKI